MNEGDDVDENKNFKVTIKDDTPIYITGARGHFASSDGGKTWTKLPAFTEPDDPKPYTAEELGLDVRPISGW